MANETCGRCRDCKHWGYNPQRKQEQDGAGKLPCLNLGAPGLPVGLWVKPDFGCVLFAAKPKPVVVEFRALHGSGAALEDIQRQVESFPENLQSIAGFTHVYSAGNHHHYLLRLEEEPR